MKRWTFTNIIIQLFKAFFPYSFSEMINNDNADDNNFKQGQQRFSFNDESDPIIPFINGAMYVKID